MKISLWGLNLNFNKINIKSLIADFLLFSFLCLTLWHSSHILATFEEAKELSWLLALGIDAGIAYAAYVATDNRMGKVTRSIAIVWLVGLLASSYGLNVSYYAGKHAGDWSWALAAFFPVSLAMLGAIKPGLVVDKLKLVGEELEKLKAELASLAREKQEQNELAKTEMAHANQLQNQQESERAATNQELGELNQKLEIANFENLNLAYQNERLDTELTAKKLELARLEIELNQKLELAKAKATATFAKSDKLETSLASGSSHSTDLESVKAAYLAGQISQQEATRLGVNHRWFNALARQQQGKGLHLVTEPDKENAS